MQTLLKGVEAAATGCGRPKIDAEGPRRTRDVGGPHVELAAVSREGEPTKPRAPPEPKATRRESTMKPVKWMSEGLQADILAYIGYVGGGVLACYNQTCDFCLIDHVCMTR